MKRIALALILFVLVFVLSVQAQDFTYTAPITTKPGVDSTAVPFYSEITNLSNHPQSFLVIKDDSGLPLEWTASFCINETCFPPFVDSSETEFPIEPGAFDSVLVDITGIAAMASEGACIMSVQPVGHPELADTIIFQIYFGTAVRENPIIPVSHALLTAYPNPFNPDLTLALSLDHAAPVTLGIYDLRGQRVAEVFTGSLTTGQHEFQWQAGAAASGIYFAQINLNGKTTVQKVVLLR